MTANKERIGVLRARVTREGEVLAWDGQPYLRMNHMAEAS